jgi:trehalose 6-phosphate synthase
MPEQKKDCGGLQRNLLEDRSLIIVSNRGPITFTTTEDGELSVQRSGGGLVTALMGLAEQLPSTWIASAASDEDRAWSSGEVATENGKSINLRFINPSNQAMEGYYGVISNPLLWFLQHSIWDFSHAPTIDRDTWQAWEQGYVTVNRLFADAVVEQVQQDNRPSLVMLQDYHLYLAPRIIRRRLRNRRNHILTHFIHIPWPGPEDWGLLPAKMRESILDGLCALDLLGFQTKDDSLNFIRTCETLLPGAEVNYRLGRITYHNRVTHVRDFPISIEVEAVKQQVETEEVTLYREQLAEQVSGQKMILRIDRTEPSKNIVRGFQAFDEMLECHPEHIGKVQFVAILVPSRLEVVEYQDYLGELMAASGKVNARYGTSDWEPVRVLVGESYPRALAAMQLYDVLLVNPVADGMNLVAKEGPTVNQNDGVIVLSERAGARQQLGEHALVIAPCDITATADALHTALVMPQEERAQRAQALKEAVEEEDIHKWMCWQVDMLQGILAGESRKR